MGKVTLYSRYFAPIIKILGKVLQKNLLLIKLQLATLLKHELLP